MKRTSLIVTFIIFLPCQAAMPDFAPGEMDSIKNMMRGTIQNTFEDIITEDGYRVLKDPFYFYTKSPRKRDIIDECSTQPFFCQKTVTFFYHETGKAVYFQNRTALNAYVDIKQQGLIEVLDERSFADIDVPEVLSLFAPVKVQERRLGALFFYQTKWKSWGVYFKLPLLYQEYNFYLTSAERDAIQNAELFKPRKVEVVAIEDGPKEKPKGSGVKKFAQKHLLSDKVGFGDLHVTFEKEIKQYKNSITSGGFDITIPVAFAFKKGIIGSYFDKKRPTPTLDLHADIIDLYGEGEHDQLKQNALDFGVATLDRLSTLVLEHPLGNDHHPGIAPFLKLILNFKKAVKVFAQVKADFLLPVSERKFFKKVVDRAAIDASADSDPDDEDEARIQVDFLSKQLVQKLFPESYKIVVFPGVILQLDWGILLKTRGWAFEMGLQTWYQSAEKFVTLPKTSVLLEIEQGRRYAALQNKLWFGILKEGEATAFELKVAGTPISYGIGRTICATFSYSWKF